MKQLTKILTFSIIAMIGFGACNDEKKPPKVPEKEGAKLLSFGFYAADNNDILEEDYMSHTITENDIYVTMPSKVDKTNLIARFTTSEGNPKVTVNGITQISQQTKNDFSVPVDYILSKEDHLNSKYTIRIKKPIEWTRVGQYPDVPTSESLLKINPINSIPYIMIIKDGSTNDEKKAALLKFDNDTWSQIGEDISEGQAADIDFTFDTSGNPYVIYSDYKNEKNQTATVQSFDGSAWKLLGRNFNDVRVKHNCISFDPADVLTAFSMNNDKKGGMLGNRALNISTYENGSWKSNQTIPVRTLANAYNMQSILKDNVLYLAIYDFANDKGTISVYKKENGAWEVLAEGMRHEQATAVDYYDLSMAIDSKNNLYVMGIQKVNEELKLITHKYSADSKSWNTLTPINLSADTRYFSIAVSPTDILNVAYCNSDKTASFVYIDPNTQIWTSPFVFNNTLPANRKVNIAFTSGGIGFAVYPDANKCLVIEKLLKE